MTAARLGILGGTFDPIHEGHLDMARACRQALQLDQILLIAARQPPHKAAPVASSHHRHAMVALATASEPALVADPRELERSGPSFTILTIEQLASERPGSSFVFIAGADSLRDLASWFRIDDLLAKATLAFVERDGIDMEAALAARAADVDAGRIVRVRHRPPPFSSRALRAMLGGSEAPGDALDPSVLGYIRKHSLYRNIA